MEEKKIRLRGRINQALLDNAIPRDVAADISDHVADILLADIQRGSYLPGRERYMKDRVLLALISSGVPGHFANDIAVHIGRMLWDEIQRGEYRI